MAIMAVVTAGIILAMQSSIVISLGMVGALSIVRFRTAIKDPMDLLFLFWSIGTGIICGAGLYEIAIILAVLVTLSIIFLDAFPIKKAPYLLVVNSTLNDQDEVILNIVKKHSKYYKIKSKNITKMGMDMIIEVRTDYNGTIVNEISKMEEVTSVSLLSYDGELRE